MFASEKCKTAFVIISTNVQCRYILSPLFENVWTLGGQQISLFYGIQHLLSYLQGPGTEAVDSTKQPHNLFHKHSFRIYPSLYVQVFEILPPTDIFFSYEIFRTFITYAEHTTHEPFFRSSQSSGNQIPTLYVIWSFITVFNSLTLSSVWASWIQLISRNAPSLQDEGTASSLSRSFVCSLLSNLSH